MGSDKGRFGKYGGRYVPETLMNALEELDEQYRMMKDDRKFTEELRFYLDRYAGRPSMLYYAKNMTEDLGGAKVYLKREDLNHTGSHKINNVLGQALLATRMGKGRIIAETGAGQHGVAAATAAALFGLECEVFMGSEDMERQALNVFRMKLLGSKVTEVSSGTGTLKDATSAALRDWTATVENTFYVIGSVVGPHPYPAMVRDFQSVIGREARQQILEMESRLPDCLIACVGGGSNAIGLFHPFLDDMETHMIGVEAAGLGLGTGKHAASIGMGSEGVIHGMKTMMLQDEDGQIEPVYSISAGLDYPGVGPEHAYLASSKRVRYESVTDSEAVEALKYLTRTEGILPALESSHALAMAIKTVPHMDRDSIVIVNLSGRGDKDVYTVADYLGEEIGES